MLSLASNVRIDEQNKLTVDQVIDLLYSGLHVKEKHMTVKELIEILKTCDENKIVNISVEHGRGLSGSDEIDVYENEDGVSIGGEENIYN